jgi:hypothetical protein
MTTSEDDDEHGLFFILVPLSYERRPWTVHEPYEMYQKYPGVFFFQSCTVQASSLARSHRDVPFYRSCIPYVIPMKPHLININYYSIQIHSRVSMKPCMKPSSLRANG